MARDLHSVCVCESASVRVCERIRDQLAGDLTRLETAVAKDDAYRRALVQAMYGTRTRRENDRGLREWAEEQLAEFKALVSDGPPGHGEDASLWQRAVDLSRERLQSKRVKQILADETARDDHSKALKNFLKNAEEAVCAAESAVADIKAAVHGCTNTSHSNSLVEQAREVRQMLARSPLPLRLAMEERIAAHKARRTLELRLRAAKRARMGCS